MYEDYCAKLAKENENHKIDMAEDFNNFDAKKAQLNEQKALEKADEENKKAETVEEEKRE